MQDLVALGTGNSRLMKSNISPSTTLSELISMLNNGTFPYDIGPLNAAGISQRGTALNKANLLTDATASSIGVSSNPTPNAAFQALRNLVSTAQSTADGRARFTTGTYTGQSEGPVISNWRTISLGYQPKAVIVSSPSGSFREDSAMAFPGWPAQARQNSGGNINMYACLQITSSGFQVRNYYMEAGSFYYMDYADNGGGLIYYYIAFQ